MKATEWDTCTDLEKMLRSVREWTSDRKLLLFACGCLRRIWHLLPDRRQRRLIEVAERHADGRSRQRTIENAIEKARGHTIRDLAGNRGWGIVDSLANWLRGREGEGSAWNALYLPRSAAGGVAYRTFHDSGQDRGATPAYEMPLWLEAEAAEAAVQRDLLRCVRGNLFRRPALALDYGWITWHDGLLVEMAQRMYDSRDFAELPILADMLEDAGCREEPILAHCRGPGPHARGCFVLDLLLENEEERNKRSS